MTRLPIKPVVLPADLRGVTPGKLPPYLLKPIRPYGVLHPLAAQAWEASGSVEPARWKSSNLATPHEAHMLALDVSKATSQLGWRNRLDVRRAIEWTVDWHGRVRSGGDPQLITLDQVGAFEQLLIT